MTFSLRHQPTHIFLLFPPFPEDLLPEDLLPQGPLSPTHMSRSHIPPQPSLPDDLLSDDLLADDLLSDDLLADDLLSDDLLSDDLLADDLLPDDLLPEDLLPRGLLSPTHDAHSPPFAPPPLPYLPEDLLSDDHSHLVPSPVPYLPDDPFFDGLFSDELHLEELPPQGLLSPTQDTHSPFAPPPFLGAMLEDLLAEE